MGYKLKRLRYLWIKKGIKYTYTVEAQSVNMYTEADTVHFGLTGSGSEPSNIEY
jgi:hypothetical protein